jgi:lysophospholipase L1-like esterase
MTRQPQITLRAKLLAAVLAVFAGLGLCEVVARAMYPVPPQRVREPALMYQTDPELGFVHVPAQAGWLDDGFATINALGLRGTLPMDPRRPGSVRILAVGDSTTFGWGVGDAETYTYQLQDRLTSAFPGRGVEVVNGGVVSYDLEQTAVLLRRLAPAVHPDIVLIGLFWNDLPYQHVSPDGEPQSASSAAPPSPGSDAQKPVARRTFRMANEPSRLNRILRASRFLFVLRHTWLGAMASSDVAANQVQWEMALLEGRQSRSIDDAWRQLEATLAGIASAAAARGFAAGVLIVPIRAQVEASYPDAEYQSRVRAIAASLGLFVVDPLPRFVEHPDRASLFIPYDRMHFSARGNALLADAAFEALRQRAEFGTPTGVVDPADHPGGQE